MYHSPKPVGSLEGRFPIGNPYQFSGTAQELSVTAPGKNAPIRAQSQSPILGTGSAFLGVRLCLMLYKRLAGSILLLHQACQPGC
jgi:hypothetical protein